MFPKGEMTSGLRVGAVPEAKLRPPVTLRARKGEQRGEELSPRPACPQRHARSSPL